MKPIIFGHRGIPPLAPENSLKSFKKILEYRIPGVELDVHLSKDNRLVVIHDFNTLKMTGEDHIIDDTEYSLLKTLDIGQRERIPLLREVLELLGSNVYFDIEVKSKGRDRKLLVSKLLLLIKEYGLDKSCIISSFDPLILRELKKSGSSIPTALIYNKPGLGVLLTSTSIIKPEITQLKGLLFFIHTKILKKEVYTWTVNSKDQYDYAVSKGCKGICSDNPQNFI